MLPASSLRDVSFTRGRHTKYGGKSSNVIALNVMELTDKLCSFTKSNENGLALTIASNSLLSDDRQSTTIVDL